MTDQPQNPDELDLTALPGGEQDIIGALPPALAACLAHAKRVIFIANNPAICASDIDALQLSEADIVVSFNTCIKYDLLQQSPVNVFVHGFNAPDQYFFGLPYRPEIQQLFYENGHRCFTLLVGCAAPMSAVPGVMLLRERIPLPALWNYPVQRPNGKRFVGPSTGFNAMVLLSAVRERLGYGYQLFALGFSNEAGKLWGGHAWDYEREWLLRSDVESLALKTPHRVTFFARLKKLIRGR